MEMIGFNGSNVTTSDANQESVSSPISCSPLSSSPVKSQAIKDLLESPIINRSQNSYHYTEEEIIVAESPEHEEDFEELSNGFKTNYNNEDNEDVIKEIPMTQELMKESTPETAIEGMEGIDRCISVRNCLKRQTSICVNNFNRSSSPRALAIFKKALKTTNNCNTNTNCDNNESNGELNGYSNKNVNHFYITSPKNSPPTKAMHNSPFSRGSALLRAAKESNSKKYGTPPKRDFKESQLIYNSDIDSMATDKQLTSILRKHELQSSPTSDGEPKAKKKRVLFAEPVVSSEREFECSQLSRFPFVRPIRSVKSIQFKSIESKLNIISNRKRNNLVHQESTFDDNETSTGTDLHETPTGTDLHEIPTETDLHETPTGIHLHEASTGTHLHETESSIQDNETTFHNKPSNLQNDQTIIGKNESVLDSNELALKTNGFNIGNKQTISEDNASDSNDSDLPLLTNNYFKECIDPLNLEESNSSDNCMISNDETHVNTSMDIELLPESHNLDDSGIPSVTEELSSSPEDSYPYPCSQPMPVNNTNDSTNSQTCETVDYSPIDANAEEEEDEDAVINVPMRLSLIRELYNIFGTLLEKYSDS